MPETFLMLSTTLPMVAPAWLTCCSPVAILLTD
jgi:hypothetical protein